MTAVLRRYSMLAVAVSVVGVTQLLAQAPAAATHPSFAGTWEPSEPVKSDRLFDVGLSAIPGGGRLMIEQRPNRLTVTITMPDDRLDPILNINGRFYSTIVYRLTESRWPAGGTGAAGPPRPTVPTWFGDRLVIPDMRPAARRTLTTFSLDGDRLKMETVVEVDDTRKNNVTEWFTRVK